MIVFVIILLFIIFIWFFYNNSDYNFENNWDFPFKRKDFLLNVPEKNFFENIKKIIPDSYIVLPQILLSSIVLVNSKKNFWAYQNKINRKTIDFVIFEKQYLRPILAVEYDGKTHKLENRKQRDDFVDNVLNKCNIPCVHITHKDTSYFHDVNKEILNHLKC